MKSTLCLVLSHGIHSEQQFLMVGMESEVEERNQNLWEGGLNWVLGFKKYACLLENWFRSETATNGIIRGENDRLAAIDIKYL